MNNRKNRSIWIETAVNASPRTSLRRNRLRRSLAAKQLSFRQTFAVVVLLIAAGSCLVETACKQASSPATVKIPLQSCSGLPCVDATFGGAKLRLLISLADQTSYLTPLGAIKADAHRPPKEMGKSRRFSLGSIQLSDIFAINETVNQAVAKPLESLTPPADGSLSYNSVSDRLLILNIPGRAIEVSTDPLRSPVCPDACSQLQYSRAADTAAMRTLTTDGFSIGNTTLHASVDTLFEGSLVLLDRVNGLPTEPTGKSDSVYRGTKLSLLESAPVSFNGKLLVNAADVLRPERVLSVSGRQYDSAVGLAILSKGAYGFDLRSMKMWRQP